MNKCFLRGIKCLFFLLYMNSMQLIDYQNPCAWHDYNIINMLKNEEIYEIIPLKEYFKRIGRIAEFETIDIFLVLLHNGEKGIFKVLKEEDVKDIYAEVIAYQLSLFLQFPHVPPTVLRVINGKLGSLQLFIESDIDLLVEGEFEKYCNFINKKELENYQLFCFVFGQYDSYFSNILLKKYNNQMYLISIDNAAIAFKKYIANYGDYFYWPRFWDDRFNTDDWDKYSFFDINKKISLYELKHNYFDIIEDQMEHLEKYAKQAVKKIVEKESWNYDIVYKNFSKKYYFILYRNALWSQAKADIKPFAENSSPETLEALKKLDKEILKNLFTIDGFLHEYFTDAYFDEILKRRDQVLEYFEKK